MSSEAPHIDVWVVDQGVKDSMMCAICHDILYQPVNLSTCPHTFCLHCLRNYIKQGQPPLCPQCITPLSSNIKSLTSTDDCISGLINEQLRKVKVACPHCHEWDGILGVNRTNLIAHRDECGEFPERSEDCGQSYPCPQSDTHYDEECPKRLVQCERCEEWIVAEDISQHHINDRECENAHICALGCGELVPDVDAAQHSDEVCSQLSVNCPVCNVKLQHHQLEAHLQTNLVSHFIDMAEQCTALREQVSKAQSEMQSEIKTLCQRISASPKKAAQQQSLSSSRPTQTSGREAKRPKH